MPRVTRSSTKKAKRLENSEIIVEKFSKKNDVLAVEQDFNPTERISESHPDVSRETDEEEEQESKDSKLAEKLSENDTDKSSETDEDEAPESITLSAGKEAAIAEIRKEKETVDVLKEREKIRRRERDEIFKKQKESRKLRELSRLPQYVLEEVAQKHDKVATQKKMKNAKPLSEHVTFESDDNEGNGTLDSVVDDPKGLQVVVLNQATKNKKGILDSATEFLKNHFYGDRLKRVETLKDVNQRKRRKLEPGIGFAN